MSTNIKDFADFSWHMINPAPDNDSLMFGRYCVRSLVWFHLFCVSISKNKRRITINPNNQKTNNKQITMTKIPNNRFLDLIWDLDIVILIFFEIWCL